MNHTPARPKASEPPADLETLAMAACRSVGLSPGNVQLLRHFATAVFAVEVDDGSVVVRVAYGDGITERSARAVTLTAWLDSLGYRTIQPLDLPGGHEQPLVVAGEQEVAVSFWRYLADAHQRDPEPEDVAELARRLHAIDQPSPVTLPTYRPLRSVRRALANADDAALGADDRHWLGQRIRELLDLYDELDFPLGESLIHADVHAGNLLWDERRTTFVLADWDSVCCGPRVIDLVPSFGQSRFGREKLAIDRFALAYGFDLRDWAGYPVLREIRDVSTLTALLRLAPSRPVSRRELHYRVRTLRAADVGAVWCVQ